jgi:hypothetical protein
MTGVAECAFCRAETGDYVPSVGYEYYVGEWLCPQHTDASLAVAEQEALDDESHSELCRSSSVGKHPKICTCCEKHHSDFAALALVGIQESPCSSRFPSLELRNCGECGSTLAVELVR